MGTDIHLAIEVRTNGVWHPVKLTEAQWASAPVFPGYNWFIRSYDLFAILAGVRNGRAFAGFKTGEGFRPIAEPRGLPNDLSSELQALASDKVEYEDAQERFGTGWLGDHSHSWLSLRELGAYDWDQTTRHAEYEQDPDLPAGCSTFDAKQIGWSEPVTYRQSAGQFYTEFMPALAKLGEPDDVRIVFGFDS